MNECLNCGKEVRQTPGKRERKYCDDVCKQKHWQKQKAEKNDTVKISRKEYEQLLNNSYSGLPVVKDIEKKLRIDTVKNVNDLNNCLLYTSPSPRDRQK